MTKRARVGFMGLAALLITGGPAPAAGPPRVDIQDFTYGPAELAVPIGARVTWTNHDEETHTVTSATGAFSSSGLNRDETFAQIFTRPGRYAYFCALHPQMKAVVVVR